MDLPKRKPTRLKTYDYSQNGAYFITFCTCGRKMLFGDAGVTAESSRLIEAVFIKTIGQYANVHCPKYVVMPNHFHAIIIIERTDAGYTPTVSEIVQSFKRYSSIEYIKRVKEGAFPAFEKRIWQRSFYDHIIRSEQEYEEIWWYIDRNPAAWEDDCFYNK